MDYTVNGIRSSGNTVSLDGSSLIDIGNNGGVIVSLNNDMVQEVKVQSPNFAAENRHRRHERERRHQVGQLEVPRLALRLLARLPLRRQRPVEQHRRHAEAEEHLSVSRRQRRRTDRVRRQLHEEPRPPVLLRRLRGAAPEGRLRLALHAHLLAGDAQRRLQRAARQSRLEPEQHPAAAGFPRGSPDAGEPAPNNNMRAVHHADRQVLRQPLSAAELQRSEQPLQLRLQRARAEQPLRLQVALRLEHQQQHQGLRPHRPRR